MNLNTQAASLIISCASKEQFPHTGQLEIVMVGKSNVGKSSLINGLTHRKRLAYVGQRPGKTRLINFFHINDDLMLVDVPGYGFANRSKQEQIHYGTLMDSYFELRHPTLMILLVDIRRGMNDEDRLMLQFANHYGIDPMIVLSKADKLSRGAAKSQALKLQREIGLPVMVFSHTQHETSDRIVEYIMKTYLSKEEAEVESEENTDTPESTVEVEETIEAPISESQE